MTTNISSPICYLRLLDADAEGADWAEVARIALARQRFHSGVAVTVHHISYAETTRCLRHPIGGLRPPMPMLTISMLLSLPRSSYGEIRHTSAITVPL
jgi:hypothetical protein